MCIIRGPPFLGEVRQGCPNVKEFLFGHYNACKEFVNYHFSPPVLEVEGFLSAARFSGTLRINVQFRGPKLDKKKRGIISKIILHAENLSVFIFKFVCFIFLTLYFSGKLSSASMASRPPTIGKTICFGLGRCDHDATIKVRESSQLTTRCKKRT